MHDRKDCEDHCPKCGSMRIDWFGKDTIDHIISQPAECQSCGCSFAEIYVYNHTEINGE